MATVMIMQARLRHGHVDVLAVAVVVERGAASVIQ